MVSRIPWLDALAWPTTRRL